MKSLRLLFLTCLLALSVLAQKETKKLIYVQQVFRHGARYPIYPKPNDFSNVSITDNAAGQLTKQGKSQHYLLGQRLYDTYWKDLFGAEKQYKQQKFYFRSTDVNRTIESIQSQLLGLFENINPLSIQDGDNLTYYIPAWNGNFVRKAGDLFDKSPFFHPLPIHVQKGPSTPWTQGDFLRSYSPQFCYKQSSWQQANKRDPNIIQITQNANFVKAVDALSNVVDKKLNFYNIYEYYDNAECLKYMGQQYLDIFKNTSSFKDDLNTISTLHGYITMFYNQAQLRTTATGYFNQTVNQFKRVTKSQAGVQWAFYSAHDTTVMNFLVRLGLTSVNCIYENYLNGTKSSDYCIIDYPTYTSQLILEVYQESSINTFKIRYNGNYRRIPFCGYQFECQVEKMYDWFQSWKDEEWVKSCGIKDTTSESYFSIIIIELGIIIIFAVSAVLRYLDNKKPQVNEPAQSDPKPSENRAEVPVIQESLLSQENADV